VSKILPPLGFALSLVAFGYAAHLSPAGILVTLATLVAMALPGILLVRLALPEDASALVVLVFGTVLGLALGRFGLALVGLAFGPGPTGAAALLGVAAIASGIALTRLDRGVLPTWGESDSREGRWLVGLLAAVTLVVAVPYSAVGQPTERGYAFAPYFDRDYMNHVAVTAELARGLPPQNPYFAGERFHYYWGSHLWPAAVKTLTGVAAREALNLTVVPTVGLFVAALCLWARPYVEGRPARYAALALGLFAFSYIGPLLLIKLAAPEVIRRLPVVSAHEYSFLSHSWFRDFLYEPHAVTALTLLLAVLVLSHRPAGRRALVGGLIGLAFGAMLVTDAFITLVGLLYFAAANLPAFLRDRAARGPLLIAAAVTVLVAVAAVAVGIFPLGGRAIRLALHPATKVAPAYLLLELGPQFVFGTLGVIVLAYRRELRPLLPLLGLLALALLLGFALKVPVEPNIVIRKSLKVAQVPLVVFVGFAVVAAAASRRRVAWAVAGALIVLPGLVTLGTDLALYLDRIEKRYPPTTYVSRDEVEMLDWVRTHTPRDAVLLMGYPERIFGEGTPLFIEALAERRTYYGNDEMPNTFQVPPDRVARRHDQVQALFAATQAAELSRVVRELPPLYLYVDEGAGGPIAAIRQAEAEGHLRHVHQSGRFSLKQVTRPPEGR
jgi:hypothetical protein